MKSSLMKAQPLTSSIVRRPAALHTRLKSSRLAPATAAAALSLALTSLASAATLNWLGNTDANFNTGANWDLTNPPANGDSIFFSAAGSSGALLNNDIVTLSLGGITFNSGAATFTIGGNALTLTGSLINNSSVTQVFNTGLTTSGAGNITVSGNFSGTGGLTAAGTGVVTITGNNSLSGGLTINSGIVRVDRESELGAGAVTLGGGTLSTASTFSGASRTVNVSSASTVDVATGFATTLNGSLTGSQTLTKTNGGTLFINGSTGNTFSGNITLAVGGGTLKVGGNIYGATGVQGGFTAANMTSANTITVNGGATFNIEDNATGSAAGYVANRFGSSGNYPAVNMQGGTFNLSGANVSSTTTQTFGALTAASGASVVNVTRNSNGTPELIFSSLSISPGAFVNFTGSLLGSGASDGRIIFNTTPGMVGGGGSGASATNLSIIPGARDGNDLVTYGANGVTALLSAQYNAVAGNNITTAATTDNVKISNATPTAFTALSGAQTINSLVVTSATTATWAMGNILTITSGQFLSTPNNTLNISSGTLTAGSGSATDFDITILQSTTTIGANINNNGSGAITLVKSGGGGLTLATTTDNNYSGGTFVNEGTLTTGATASRLYLGTGPVTVNNGTLTLGAIGATSFSGNHSTPTYTVKTGGQVTLPNVAAASNEYFNIAAGAAIANSGTTGAGGLDLNTNLNAASGAILAETGFGANVAIKKGGVAIGTALTTPTYFFGLAGNQLQENITVGAGTPWLGISTDRSNRTYNGTAATNNTITANGDFTLQGMTLPGAGAPPTYTYLTLGNGAGANNIKIATPNGSVNANIVGLVTLNNDTSIYGSAGNTVTFQVNPGAIFTLTTGTALGSGAGIASAVVQDGGSLAIGNIAAINGSVTVQSGGYFKANQASLTGTGALTFNTGSIIDVVTNATGFSGSQASAATVNPGAIVRLDVGNFGAAGTPLDTFFASKGPVIYEVYGGNNGPVNPTAAGTTIMTLNQDAAGLGGILTNDASSRTPAAAANGVITIGDGKTGVIAASTNTTLTVPFGIALGSGTLNIGSTQSIDGAVKTGIVSLSVATGATTASAGALVKVNAGTLTIGAANTLPSLVNMNLAAGATLTVSNAQTLAGTFSDTASSTINGASTLTLSGAAYNLNSIFGFSGGGLTFNGSGNATLNGAYTNNGGGTTITSSIPAASGSLTLSGPVYLSETQATGRVLTIAGTGNTLISGVIADSAAGNSATPATSGLTITNTGTTTITNSNTYTGNTTLGTAGSWLVINNDAALGSGTLVLSNATASVLSTNGTRTLPNAVSMTVNGTSGIITGTTALTFNGLVANNAVNPTTLTVNDTAGVTLAGGLNLTKASDGSARIVTINGTGPVTISGTVANGGSGNSGLTYAGSSSLTLTGSNSFTGATTVTGGTLQVGNGISGSLAVSSSVTVNTGGTLAVDLASSGTFGSYITTTGANGSAAVSVLGSGTNTFGSNIIGPGAFNQSGSGLTIFGTSSNFTYAGLTNITNGALQLNTSLTNSTVSVGVNNGLVFGLNNPTIGGLTGSGNVALVNGTNAVTLTTGADNASTVYSGVLSGQGGALTKTGTGTMTLSASNTYTGATTVSNGTLSLQAAGAVSAGTFTLSGGTFTQTLDNAISGTAAFTQGGATSYLYNNANNYTGATTLSTTGTAAIANANAFGNGASPVTISAASILQAANSPLTLANNITLTANPTVNGTNSLTLSGSLTISGTNHTLTSSIPAASGSLTLSGPVYLSETQATGRVLTISGSGNTLISGVIADSAAGTSATPATSGLTISNTGTTSITNSNTYTGTTTINGATIAIGNANAFGNGASPVTLSGGATLQAAGAPITLANNITLSYTGYVSGTNSLTLSGSFTNSLSNYSLTNNISAAAGTLTLGGSVYLSEAKATGRVLTIAGTGNTLISGVIADSAAGTSATPATSGLTITNTGTTTITNSNTYTGTTTINGATIAIGNANAFGNGASPVTLSGGATLQAAGAPITLANNITLSYTGYVSGTNSLTLSGSFTNSGNNRTLTSSIPAASGSLTLSGPVYLSETQATGRVLTIAGTGNTLISGVIADSAAGTSATPATSGLTISSTGTTSITNSNTYTGATTLSGAGSTIAIANANAFGNGASLVTINAVTLQASGAPMTLANNLILANNPTVSGTNSLTLNGSLTNSGGNRTLTNNIPAAAGTLTLGGSVYLSEATGSGRTLTIAGTGNTLISGVIANYSGGSGSAGALTITSSGTTTLSGSNTYTGASTVSVGVVNFTGANSGGGGLAVSSGTVNLTGAYTVGSGNLIANSATGVFIEGPGATITGAGGVNQTGTAGSSITLSGSNSYTGVTTVQNYGYGTLWLGNTYALGTGTLSFVWGSLGVATPLTGASAVPNNWQLNYNNNNSITGTNSLTLSGTGSLGTQTAAPLNNNLTGGAVLTLGPITINGNGATPTLTIGGSGITILSGVISNGTATTPTLTVTSTGTTSITNSNTFTGLTTLNAATGTLVLTTSNSVIGGLTVSNGTVNLQAAGAVSAGTFTLTSGTFTQTADNAISGNAAFTQGGASSYLYTSANNYTGATTLSTTGTVAIANANAFGNGASAITISGASIVQAANSPLTLANNITLTANPTVNGANSLTLSGSLTNSGGNRTLTSSIPAASGSLTLSGPVYLSEAQATGRVLTIAGTGNTLISGVIADSAAGNSATPATSGLTITNTGTTTITNSNTFTGLTTMNAAAGTLVLTPSNSVIGGLTMSNGTVNLQAAGAVSGGTLNYSAGTLNEVANAIGGSAALTVSAGTLTLSQLNNYTGATTLNGGTLVFSGTGQLGSGSVINFGGGTLQYASGNTDDITLRTVNLVSGTSTINTNGNNVTFANSIGGTGGLFKVGSGTLTLSGSNTFTGLLAVTGNNAPTSGTLILKNAAAWGTGAGGIQLGSSTNNANDDGHLVLATGTAMIGAPNVVLTHGVTNYYVDSITFDAPSPGAAGFTQNFGTLTMSQKDTLLVNQTANFSSAVTAAFGAVDIQATNGKEFYIFANSPVTLASVSAGVGAVATSATLYLGGTAAGSGITGQITTGVATSIALVKTGAGTWSLAGSAGGNTYAANTTIQNGTLVLNEGGYNNALLTSGSLIVVDGALSVNSTAAVSGTQTVANLTMAANAMTSIALSNASSGTANFTATTFTKAAANTLYVDLSATGAGNVNTGSTLTQSSGLLGWAVVKDATATGFGTQTSGNIVRYTGATTALASGAGVAGTNYTTSATDSGYSGGTLALGSGAHATNSLAINTSNGAGVIDLGGGNLTIASGGLLATGTGNYTIQSGSLGAAATELDIHQYSSGTLLVSATLNNTSAALVKDGPGTLQLTGASTTGSGATVINQGTVQFAYSGATANPMGTSSITINGGGIAQLGASSGLGVGNAINFGAGSTGKLQLNGNNFTTTSSIITAATSSYSTLGAVPVIENASSTPATLTLNGGATVFNGLLQDGVGGGALALAVTGGTGVQTFAGPVTLSGGITVSNGTLALSSPLNTFTGNVTVNSGGILDIAMSGLGYSQSTTASYEGVLGSAANTVTLNNGGTLQFNALFTNTLTTLNQLNRPVTINGTGVIDVIGDIRAARTLTINSVISESASLSNLKITTTGYSSVGTAAFTETYTANNTFTGGVLVAGVNPGDTTFNNDRFKIVFSGSNQFTKGLTIDSFGGANGVATPIFQPNAAGALGQNVSGNDVNVNFGEFQLSSTAYLGSNQKVNINGIGGVLSTFDLGADAALPSNVSFKSNYGGVLGLVSGTCNTPIDLSNVGGSTAANLPIYLGVGMAVLNQVSTYNASTLGVGPNSTYRLGAGSGPVGSPAMGVLVIANPVLTGATNSVLIGKNGWFNAGGEVRLNAANTYGGNTTVGGGQLTLQSAGSILNSGTIIVSTGAALKIDNTTNNANRITDTTPVYLNGGTFNFYNPATASTAYAETVGALNLGAGGSTIVTSQASATAGSTTLTFASVARSVGGTVNFSGTGVGVNSQNQVVFTGTGGFKDLAGNSIASGAIIPWATVQKGLTTADVGLATYSGSNTIALYSYAAGETQMIDTGTASTWGYGASFTAASNVKLTTALTSTGTAGGLTVALPSGTTTINSLTLMPTYAANNTSGDTLNIGAGATLAITSGAIVNWNAAANAGTGLTAATGGWLTTASGVSELVVHALTNFTLDAPIKDPDGSTKLSLVLSDGAIVLYTTGSNTYSGNTYINNGAALRPNNPAAIPYGPGKGDVYDYGNFGNASGQAMQVNGLWGNGIVNLVTQTITIGNNNATSTFGGQNISSGGMTKTGTGTLTLTGISSYGGVTTVNGGGVLEAASLRNGTYASAIGAASASGTNLVICGNSTLRYTGLDANSTDRLFQTGTNTAAGDTATIDVAATAGALTWSNPGSILYGTANQPRTLVLSASNAAANTFAPLIANNGTAAVSLTKNGSGTWVLAGSNSYSGTTTVTGGTLQLGNGGTTGSLSPNSGITNNATLVYNRANTLTQGTDFGAISGSGNVVQAGTGTTIISASNSYSGGTTVNGGTLQIANATALGTGGLTVNGGTLDLHGNSVNIPAFGGAGGTVTNQASGTSTLTTSVASGTSTYAGNIANGTGVVVLTNSGAATVILSGSLTMAGLNANGGVTQLTQSGSIGAVSVGTGATLSMAAHSGSNYNVLNVSSLTISGFSSSLASANGAATAGATYTPTAAVSQMNAGVLTDKGIAVTQAAGATSDLAPASPEAVPEPGTLGMLLAGASALLGFRRKAKGSNR